MNTQQESQEFTELSIYISENTNAMGQFRSRTMYIADKKAKKLDYYAREYEEMLFISSSRAHNGKALPSLILSSVFLHVRGVDIEIPPNKRLSEIADKMIGYTIAAHTSRDSAELDSLLQRLIGEGNARD